MQNMTKYFISKIFSSFYSLNSKLVFIIAVFSFYTSYNLRVLNELDCSVFEYALFAMSDHYYLVFFFLLMYCVIIMDCIKDSNPFILLRARSYFSYYVSKLTAIALFTISIVFFQAVLAMIIGSMKHGLNNSFSASISSITSLSELSGLFHTSFQSPLAALISVCLYLSLGLCVCAGALILLSHFFTEKAVILTEICVYLLIIVTLQLNIDRTVPYLFILNYLILHRAIGYGLPLVFIVISLAVVIIMIFIANRQRRRIFNHVSKVCFPIRIFGEVFTYKSIIAFVILLFVLSALTIMKYKTDASSGSEFTIMIFNGYGLGYLNFIDFFHLIIINGIPIYILSAFLGDRSSMRGIVMIRYSHRSIWFSRVQLSMLALIVLQITLMCLFTFLIGSVGTSFGILGGNEAGGMLSDISSPVAAIMIGFILRVFEIMFLQMIFLVAFSLVKSVIASFLITMSLYLSIVIFNGRLIPFGLSSLCRVLELSDKSLLVNSFIPAIIFAGCYAGMYMYLVKSDAVRILVSERSHI